MAMFKAFKPSGMEKIARSMGYQGNMQGFQDFLSQDPMRQQRMQQFTNQAVQMARGGIIKMQEGGTTTPETTPTETPPVEETPTTPPSPSIGNITVDRMTTGALPAGGVKQVATTPISQDQMIQTGTGMLDPRASISTAVADTSQADAVQEKQANTMEAAQVAPAIDTALNTVEASQTDPNDPRAKVIAAQQAKSSVGDLEAAQGNAILLENPVQREIQDGELIEPTFNAEKAAKFTEEVQAAQATPSEQATVQGQLEGLMQQFEDGQTPAWAAGAMRAVKGQLAKRGLSASSIAGQALVQAALESALPIAQADANITAKFEAQNLSNRQQTAMLHAEQRAKFIGMEFDQAFQTRVLNASKISDIANMNFTAEQQIALENSRIANTVNLQNLGNRQALVMAEAGALANLDMSNLNNRQQASVMNAQSFLQMDMANLNNRQQTEMFTAQQRIQSLFTDQAAENASRQFNASSQNQVDQFFSNLASQVSQFNSAQTNAQNQFNAGQINTIERFNQEINNQRDQFNAQNQLVIQQANAQWRRQIATADTAAVNRANEINAAAVLDISNTAYANLWNYYADTMEWAWTSAENNAERIAQMAMAELDAKARKDLGQLQIDASEDGAIGGFITDMLTSPLAGTFLGGILR